MNQGQIPTNSPSGNRRIGKYHILGVIGTGSMGVVYRGLDPEIERPVAIKTLFKINAKTVLSVDSIMERIRTEARFAGNLRHPHIVTIFEIGRDRDTPFIVMDYVEGRGLDGHLSRGEAIPVDFVRRVLKQVGSALDYAHQQSVIHRDIKPANILVREGGDLDGEVAIVDFGVAAINASLDRTPEIAPHSPVVGSAGYMSPEQIKSERVDARSDLFSAAIVTFECLTGRRPFMGDDAPTVIRNILNAPPLSARSFRPELAIGIDEFFTVALSKKKEDRFQSGADLSAAFERVLEGKSLIAEVSSPIIDTSSPEIILDVPASICSGSEGARAWAEARAVARFRMSAVLLAFACIGAGAMFVWSAVAKTSSPISKFFHGANTDTRTPARLLGDKELRAALSQGETSDYRTVELLDEALRRDLFDVALIVVPFLNGSDAAVRRTALRVIGLRGNRSFILKIAHLLNDPTSEVRAEAARSLASLGDERGINLLAKRIEIEPDASVHTVLNLSLAKLRKTVMNSE